MSSIVREEVNGSIEPDGHLRVGVQIQDLVKVRYLSRFMITYFPCKPAKSRFLFFMHISICCNILHIVMVLKTVMNLDVL